ncbi:hypothetical protein BDB00DRAFT_535811 [Zychaea mexicana]|uniref:uncharacterized protein n=1 Tax=Zychaea mexicana TaxID=64656 RepID=UPI0022FF0AA3|nr:uncharacterized protein BDB00DRAFT_535811 [Zychaea mexicana]KAI9490659.1 hypothetical protein BDB00DRAFT_535811 [Zychaea mexicana]
MKDKKEKRVSFSFSLKRHLVNTFIHTHGNTFHQPTNRLRTLTVGFRHSSFAFQHESQVQNSAYRDAEIQPGALINIIHKGLQFMDIEAHMNEDGELMECNVPFSLLEPHHCDLTGKTFNDSQQALSPTPSAKRQRKEKAQKEREKRARRDNNNVSTTAAAATSTITPAAAATGTETESAVAAAAAAASGAPINGISVKEENATTTATGGGSDDGK